MLNFENIKINLFYKRQDFVIIFCLILFYLLIYFIFRAEIIGYWESLSIYSMLEPRSYPPLPNIQIRGDTTGGQGLGYPLLIISKYFSNLFTLSLFSLKYLYLVYTSLFLILFYKFIQRISDRYVSIFSLIILILNPYFIYMSTFLSAQQISLTLIFLLLFFISDIKKKSSPFYFFITSVFISLVLMNYIYGRYLLLVILFYYFLDHFFEKEVNKTNFFISVNKFLKLTIFSLIMLIFVYPPNLGIIFSKELFLPVIDKEIGIFDYNIFELFYLNFNYFIKVFFLSADSELYFNIINGEKVRVFNFYLQGILLIGLLTAIIDKKMAIINLITLTLILLICLSYSDFTNSKVTNTSISIYRFYMCIPFLCIYIGYGLNKILDFFKFLYNKKKIICVILISIFSIYNFVKLDISKDKYKQIKSHISNKNYKKKFNIKLDNKVAQKQIENDYHLKILNLSNNINKYLETEFNSNNLEYIYLVQDIDFSFNKIPPRLKNFDKKKYQFHIFNTLYLNNLSNKRFSYLINSHDNSTLLKKIFDYGKIKDINGSLLDYKILEKKIGKLLSKIIKKNYYDKEQKFTQAKISYFHKPDFIIIYSKEEYEFVVNDLNKKVNKLLLSNFF